MDGSADMPSVARYLGYGGVIPFLAMALNQIAGGPLPVDFALKVFLYYSAAILSFLGGIRWGAATRLNTGMSRELVVSIVPSLWAVGCLLLGSTEWTIGVLLLGYVLMGIVDALLPVAGIAAWMTGLRVQLTIAVAICHLLLMFGM
jgi:hypothetical protein